MLFIHFWLSFLTYLLTAKNVPKLKLQTNPTISLSFLFSKAQKISFDLKFYIDLWETKYPENLKNLIYIHYYAFIKGICKALSALMMIFCFDPLETKIVLQCWSVSYIVVPVARLEAFKAVKLFRLESFRALKFICQTGRF